MGDVYLAEHRLLKRLCAVKLIRADMSEDPVMVTRFEREVRATAALTHWNTVQVFDYGQTAEGTFFYVMEHLHGKNLRQLVLDFGPMSEARVIFVLRQVAEALREAAARNLVHRDIKPSNVFLAEVGGRFDVVKLLDFGLVRPLTSFGDAELSVGNELKGSPRYMCPEQAQGQAPDTRGDLYSLGATAYFLLAGRPPFDLENPLQLVIAHATQPAPTFAESGAFVSPELAAIVMKCLRKLPEDRFQSPDEFIAALDALPHRSEWNWKLAEEWWKRENLDTGSAKSIAIGTTQTPTKDDDSALEETLIDRSVL
jgi:eukaryotic-like serine/threonine-protein kinase